MDDKTGVLETPQISSFKHENVFGITFREEIQKSELSALPNASSPVPESPVPPIVALNMTLGSQTSLSPTNQLQNGSASSSAASSSSGSISISSSSSSAGNSNGVVAAAAAGVTTASTPNDSSSYSLKSAPKKNILFRTISQTEAEMQKQAETPVKLYNQNSIIELAAAIKNDIPTESDEKLKPDYNNNNASLLDRHEFHELVANQASFKRAFSITESLSEKLFPPLKLTSQMSIEKYLLGGKTTNDMESINWALMTNGQSNQYTNNEFYLSQSSRMNSARSDNNSETNNTSRSSPSSTEETVTSSDQLTEKKFKTKRRTMASNTDQRKEQIRNSNREAARRCRERRRNYIETLETKLRNLETKQEALAAENNALQKENHGLKRLLYEHKDCNMNGLSKLITPKNDANLANYLIAHQKQVQSQHQQQDSNKNMNVPLLLTFPEMSSLESMSRLSQQQQQQSQMTQAQNGGGSIELSAALAGSANGSSGSAILSPQLSNSHSQIYQKLVDVLLNNGGGGGGGGKLQQSDLYAQQLKQNLAN